MKPPELGMSIFCIISSGLYFACFISTKVKDWRANAVEYIIGCLMTGFFCGLMASGIAMLFNH